MRATLGSLLVGALATVLACAPAPAPPVDTGAALAALREADAAYSRAGVARDLEAFMAAYTTDAVAYPPNEATVSGADAIRGYIGRFFQDTAFSITFQPVSAEISTDGTMGYTLNTGDLRATGPDGKPMAERMRDFHVWRKQADGSWKLALDIWNVER